jgi:hypothetical protein
MQIRRIGRSLVVTVALGGIVSTTLGQAPAPPPPPPTLWSFLGIPQGLRYLRDNTLNRTGNRPALERKPPLKPIGDPSNLKSEDPAIKKAAEVKQAEDQKKQKIKAVKFLAQIGCGCYNRDGSITDALLKAMDDCTEEVRLATVQAITEAAMGEMCVNCKRRSCCSEELTNKLYEIAYERDETGCFLEPSERVRNAAAEALRACCAQSEEFAPLTPVPSGGERPGAAPPAGGERPQPPQPPQPTPAQPPAAFLPGIGPEPAGKAPVRTSTDVPSGTVLPRSSRRTSQAPQASSLEDRLGHGGLPSSGGQPQDASTWLSACATESRPHWAPASSAASVTFLPPSRLLPLKAHGAAELPLADLAPPAAVLAQQVAPGREVATASFQRLPAIQGMEPAPASQAAVHPGGLPAAAEAGTVPPPPLPPAPATSPAGAAAFPVSAARPQMSFLKRSDGASLAATPASAPVASAQPLAGRAASPVVAAVAPPVGTGAALGSSPAEPEAAASRAPAPRRSLPPLPGSQFGTGSVLSVRPKDQLVVLQFAPGSAVPAGSLVRVYHEYALAGKKAVCDLEVVRGENGIAAAVPREGNTLAQISAGDEAIVLR